MPPNLSTSYLDKLPVYVRRKACAAVIGIGVSTHAAWCASGKFPPGHKINGVRVWALSDVQAFVEGRA